MTAGFYLNYALSIWGDGVTTIFTATLTQNPVLNSATSGYADSHGGVELGTPVGVSAGGSGYTVTLSGHVLTITFAVAPPSVTGVSVSVIYSG